MARYEYSCDDCKDIFTITEPMAQHTDQRQKKGKGKKVGPKCPECGSRKTHQVFSSFFAKTSSKS